MRAPQVEYLRGRPDVQLIVGRCRVLSGTARARVQIVLDLAFALTESGLTRPTPGSAG